MVILKYCLQNITLLNFGLLIGSILIGNYILFPIFKAQMLAPLSLVKTIPSVDEKIMSSENHSASPTDYIIVAENNIFHPERKIPLEKKVEQPLPKPEFLLYGTVLADSVGFAYLEDQKAPRNTPGRGKRQTALKKGDSISGFVVKEIRTDNVVLVRGEENIVVYVRDKHKAKTRESAMPVAAKASHQPLHQQQSPPASQSAFIPSKEPKPVEPGVLPPQNAEEQSIINFIEKGRQHK